MPVRPSLQYVIDFVHTLIDSSDTDPLSDQDVQDMLDLNRLDVYQKPLVAAETLTATGQNAHHDFYAPGLPFWETDAVLQNSSTGATLTADDENHLLGRWHFDTAQTVEVVVTGKVYNVYYAASKLAMKMVMSLRADFNFTADGLTVQRIGRINDLKALSTELASKGWSGMQTIKMVRKDQTGERSTWRW